MRFFFLLFLLCNILFSQYDYLTESVENNKVRINFNDVNLKNRFIVIPNISHEIEEKVNIEISYAFSRNGNLYYEIDHIDKSAKISFVFSKSISHYLRKKDNIALNKQFLGKNRKNKTVAFPKTYLHDLKSIKIYTEKKGVYRIFYDDFVENGIDINSTDYIIDRLKLINKGKEVPVYIESGDNRYLDKSGEFIAFYAERSLNTNFPETTDLYYDPYDKRNLYWLTLKQLSDEAPAKRLYSKNGQNIEADQDKLFEPRYFNRQEHLETNSTQAKSVLKNIEHKLQNFGVYHNRDFMLWGGSIRTDQFRAFDISVLNDFYKENGDKVNFKVMMSGGASSYGGKHAVEFKVSTASVSFTNENWYLSHKKGFNFDIDVNDLHDGGLNTFEVKTISPNDYVFLNYIELGFKSKFKARSNYLEFSAISPTSLNQTAYEYTITGFNNSNIWLFKKSEALIANGKIQKNGNEYQITFQDEIENRNSEFIAFTEDQFQQASLIRKNNSLKNADVLKNFRSDAEMLILSTEAFLPKAQEYATFNNQTRNLKSEVINVDLIYNEYNYGLESPVAIKRFLEHAYINWSSSNNLKYLLIMGDSKRNYLEGSGLDYIIPGFQFISNEFGFVSSDAFYGYLNFENQSYFPNNPFSELHVGRIPAESVVELDAYIQKAKSYIDSDVQPQDLFLSGNDYDTNVAANRELNSNDRVFLSQLSRMHHNLVPDNKLTAIRRAASDPPAESSAVLQESSQLIDLFNRGLNYVTFMGHGAGAVWGDRNIFLQEDAKRLQNTNRYPIIASMTCFIGAYDDNVKTLGEVLVLERNKGAIGLIGSSGVSLLYNQYMLGYYLNDYVYQNRYSFGEVISLGKYKYYKRGARYVSDSEEFSTPKHLFYKTLMAMEFNFLGDPSLRIKSPEKATINTTTTEILKGETVNFTINNIENSTYNGEVILYDYLGEPLFKKEYFGRSGTEISDNIVIDTIKSSMNVFYIKGYLKSSGKTYNFGKKLFRKGSQSYQVSFVDPDNLSNIALISGRDYKLKIDIDFDYDQIVCDIIRNDFRSNSSKYSNVTLTKNGNSYISNSAFFVDKRDVSLDIINVRAKKNSETTKLRNKSFEIKPLKYYVAPIDQSIKVAYTDKTEISVGVVYPVSYKNELTVYVDYFRENLNSLDSLGRDTIRFKSVNTSLVSQLSLIENYNGQSFNYFVKVKTDSINKELAPEDAREDKLIPETPNAYIQNGADYLDTLNLQNGINLVYNLSRNNYSQSTPLSFGLSSINKNSKPGLLNNYLKIVYHNNNFDLKNLAENSASIILDKQIADTLNTNNIIVEFYDDNIKSWLELISKKSFDSNNNLVIAIPQGIAKSGYYNLIEKTGSKPEVTINFEVEKNVADSIEFASINPQIKVNLISHDQSYVLNPKNVILKIIDENNDSTDLIPSFSYSGTNNSNLNLLVDRFTNLNKSGSYKVFAKLLGSAQLRNKKGTLLNNEATQLIEVSGENSLRYYGNYPNPFSEKTIFTYQLTSSSYSDKNDLKIKIYTISGHLIKTIDDVNAVSLDDNFYSDNAVVNNNGTNKIGMNYIRWNGQDDNGNEVANGVYFVKIVYKTSDKTIEKITKVLKFKGI